jgi:hypothetical protein
MGAPKKYIELEGKTYELLKTCAGYEGRTMIEIVDGLIRAYLEHNKEKIDEYYNDFWNNPEPFAYTSRYGNLDHDKMINMKKIKI